ncbi:hypothetical protein Cgig2_023935 [Carnegiea gigantea]|uniref:Uncharacterized protein n=1 Tax=Carnegiea gigantea TaxID=171969 RepID=A0A9Q1QAE8_9CARY|nr:hypothetical protein Cgig2_023935 [Carnegiea gigantea]
MPTIPYEDLLGFKALAKKGGLFEMLTFIDKTTNGRRYLCIRPSESEIDGEETKLPICNSITSLCKSDYIGGPPSLFWWSKENLKTDETFLLSSHIKSPGINHELGRKGKQTIEQWIAFWFRGRNKYHISRKSDQDYRIPHPGILSPWVGDYQVIFDELGVAIGQRTENFLATFLSCWLCTFILPVRDAYCIRPGTFSVAAFMASGVGYCLLRVYKGLNEISRSSHLGRGGVYFPAYFLCACLAKNFDAYELAGEASSCRGMVKFSGLGQAKSF